MLIFMLQQPTGFTNIHYGVNALTPKVQESNIGVAFSEVAGTSGKVQYHVLVNEVTLNTYRNLEKYLKDKLALRNKRTLQPNIVMFSSDNVSRVIEYGEVDRVAKEIVFQLKLNAKQNLLKLNVEKTIVHYSDSPIA